MPRRNQTQDLPVQQQHIIGDIKGPDMDWSHNDGLYLRFLTWKQLCEIILSCQLEHASESRRRNSVLQWSGSRGIEIYNSWSIAGTPEDSLEVYWQKWQAYCLPKANDRRARYDLWHSTKQGQKSVEEHYSAIMNQSRIAFPAPDWPQGVREKLMCDAFIFMLENKKTVQRCIQEQSTLQAAKDIAKQEESSSAAAKHIMGQASSEVNMLRHQRTKVPYPKKGKKKKHGEQQSNNPQGSYKDQGKHKKYSKKRKNDEHQPQETNKKFKDNKGNMCTKCGDTAHRQGFYCPASKFKCQTCHKVGHFTSRCFRNAQKSINAITTQDESSLNTSAESADDWFIGASSTTRKSMLYARRVTTVSSQTCMSPPRHTTGASGRYR